PLYTLAHDGGALGDRRWAKYGTAIDDGPDALPVAMTLKQNYPNPFNPTTTIWYELNKAGKVTLDVIDAQGKKIATLVNGQKPAGSYAITFNGQNLASGVYFYRLTSGSHSIVRKMLLIK
ncbi:T9SS C-terminal target domain-containing protein, partial [Candidatus Parcubacteria bacterium]